ncbi:MAG: hypothetical protein IPJ97_15020 [Proteobacteria bacterium]|nr:hypothetical protein [Pseudomonadota bacterium]
MDVVGYQAGALAAIELALARPEQVRRLILIGVPSSDSGYQVGERLPLLKLPVMILQRTGRNSGSPRVVPNRCCAMLVASTFPTPPASARRGTRRNRAVRARLPRSLAAQSQVSAW